jgi:hypothetical protein
VPLPLVQATARAAGLLAGGQLAAAGLASTPAAAITDAVLKAMLLGKLRVVTAVVLVLAIVASGVSAITHRAWEDKQSLPSPQSAASPDEGPKDVARSNTLTITDHVVEAVNVAQNTISVAAPKPPPEPQVMVWREVRLTFGKAGQGVQVHPIWVQVPVRAQGLSAPRQQPKAAKLARLPVAKDARIIVTGAPGKLTGLKAGMRVTLELGTDAGKIVVRSIQAQP